MSLKRSRALLCSGVAPLALLFTAGGAGAQTPPGPAPAAPATATPPAPATAPVTPGELPKSRTQTELEARLHAMRSGKGLTADDAAKRSVRNSAALEAKQHAIETVEGQLGQTKYAFWPTVKLSASYTRLSPVHPKFGTPAIQPGQEATAALLGQMFAPLSKIPENSTSLDGTISIPLSDYLLRLSHSIAGSSRAREAAVFDRSATFAAVDRDARVAYYAWVRSQAQQLIAAQALEQAKGHEKDAQNAFQAGLLSKADVLGTQAAVKNAELFGERARNQTELARLSLEISMGDAPGQAYEVGEDVFAPSPALQALPPSPVAFREATTRRMELKGLVSSEQALREQAVLERVGDYPRLDGHAGVTYANPNPRFFPQTPEFNFSWQAGVALTWIPTDIGAAESARDVANAKAAELAAQRRGLLNGLRLEIEQALKAAEEARYTIEVSGHALIASEESYRVRRELFRAGRATLVEVTDSETELTRARLEVADAFVNSRIALAQLRHALGRDTEPTPQATR